MNINDILNEEKNDPFDIERLLNTGHKKIEKDFENGMLRMLEEAEEGEEGKKLFSSLNNSELFKVGKSIRRQLNINATVDFFTRFDNLGKNKSLSFSEMLSNVLMANTLALLTSESISPQAAGIHFEYLFAGLTNSQVAGIDKSKSDSIFDITSGSPNKTKYSLKFLSPKGTVKGSIANYISFIYGDDNSLIAKKIKAARDEYTTSKDTTKLSNLAKKLKSPKNKLGYIVGVKNSSTVGIYYIPFERANQLFLNSLSSLIDIRQPQDFKISAKNFIDQATNKVIIEKDAMLEIRNDTIDLFKEIFFNIENLKSKLIDKSGDFKEEKVAGSDVLALSNKIDSDLKKIFKS